MSPRLQTIRDAIIARALPGVAFDGWTKKLLETAADEAGYGRDMAEAVFPGGVGDALDHFADYIDRAMLKELARENPQAMRVRDRIGLAVMTRLDMLEPHREAERLALTWWTGPSRSVRGAKILWRTADRIWNWAGDTAKDYNHYTKRALLSGVIGTTTLAWLEGEQADSEKIHGFLDRRIENVMQIGRLFGKVRKTG